MNYSNFHVFSYWLKFCRFKSICSFDVIMNLLLNSNSVVTVVIHFINLRHAFQLL